MTTSSSAEPSLSTLIEPLRSSDVQTQLQGARGLRERLDGESGADAAEEIGTLVVPLLIPLLSAALPELVFEVGWCLAILSSQTHAPIGALIEAGAVPALAKQLEANEDPELRAQAAAVLSQIAGDSAWARDLVLQQALHPLLANLDSPRHLTLARYAAFAVRTLLYGKPRPGARIDIAGDPSDEVAVRKGAAWTMENAASGATPGQLRLLLDHRCISPLSAGVSSKDAAIVLASLGALEALLTRCAEDDKRRTVATIDELNGVEAIEAAQLHPSIKVYEKAQAVLKAGWELERERDPG
jgi:hypothetical protein